MGMKPTSKEPATAGLSKEPCLFFFIPIKGATAVITK
jgi:hypothetical protein